MQPHSNALTNRSKIQRKRAQKDPNKIGIKEKMLRRNSTTKHRNGFQGKDSRTHLNAQLQGLRSCNPQLPTSCIHSRSLEDITTYKSSTRMLEMAQQIKRYKDFKVS